MKTPGLKLEYPSRELIQGDSAWGNLIDGAGDLIDRGGEVPVIHSNDGLACLLDPVEDLLVFDLEFGAALCLPADLLPVGVVLTGVGSYICQNGELVDFRVVFRIDVCEFGMESRVTGSGETGIAGLWWQALVSTNSPWNQIYIRSI